MTSYRTRFEVQVRTDADRKSGALSLQLPLARWAFYEPDEFPALLAEAGWGARILATRWFIFGSAQPT
jgi:hypothetical protein